jgi:hypothetical protein
MEIPGTNTDRQPDCPHPHAAEKNRDLIERFASFCAEPDINTRF